LLEDEAPQGLRRSGTAWVPQAEAADLLEALGEDLLKEPTDTCDGNELGGALPPTSRFPIREGHGAVREGDDPASGESNPEDSGGKGGEGGGPIGMGLAVDLPGDAPDLGIDGGEETGVWHVVCDKSAVDGRERFHGDKEGGSGREPLGTVVGEATTWDDGGDVGMRLELPAPGREDAGKAGEVGADAALVCGEPCEGFRGRGEQGLRGRALLRAHAGAKRLRDGKGEEDMRPWEVLLQLVQKPALGGMVLTLGAVAVAAGVMDTVLSATAVAPREAMTVMSAVAMAAGGHGLAVRQRQLGKAFEILWRIRLEDSLDGGHERSPCRSEVRRW